MIDLLLLAGSALCVISIIMAAIAVVQTRAPRGAAIALMLGITLLLVGAKMEPAAVTPDNVMTTWQRMLRGEITLRGPVEVPADTAPAPEAQAPATTPAPTPAPAAGDASTDAPADAPASAPAQGAQ